MTVGPPPLALVHDYLTQRGGAERVVLALLKAFPSAPLYTSLYAPAQTFPEFRDVDVRPLAMNRIPQLRADHRRALAILAPAFSRLVVDAGVVLCSSSGWAHGVSALGRKVVYCHNPARWLYQGDDYLPAGRSPARSAVAALRRPLVAWDRRAAASAHRYLANSSIVAERVRSAYGIEAEVIGPPGAMEVQGPGTEVAGMPPGFLLSVGRLKPYKNVDALIEAFRGLPGERLVVAGTGPEGQRLSALAPPNVTLLGEVDDPRLRWLYERCDGVISASREDYGLTPLEGLAFGKPAIALRFGGFLDTIAEGRTGLLFDDLRPESIRHAVTTFRARPWRPEALAARAEAFSEERFIARMRGVVAQAASRDGRVAPPEPRPATAGRAAAPSPRA